MTVRVGVAVLLYRPSDGALLMGKRKGSHGVGKWAFPGGHMEEGETVAEAASRELLEETGIRVPPQLFEKVTFTNDIFRVEGKHYITLYVRTQPTRILLEPQLLEPAKCEEWRWVRTPPSPLFLPIENLIRDGFWPWPEGRHK